MVKPLHTDAGRCESTPLPEIIGQPFVALVLGAVKECDKTAADLSGDVVQSFNAEWLAHAGVSTVDFNNVF